MGRLLNAKSPQPGYTQAAPRQARNPARQVQQSLTTPPAQAATASAEQGEAHEPLHVVALYAGLAMLVLRMAVVPEALFHLLGFNTYLLYVVAPPAIVGALATGAVVRAFSHRSAWLWLLFMLWMTLAVPFSSWKGGSVGHLKSFVMYSFPLLVTVGGLAATWSEVRTTFSAMGLAGVLLIIEARFLSSGESGRIEMSAASTTIGNSNDLASCLVLVLPFLLFIFLDQRRSSVVRYSMIPLTGYALWIILGTASRGALVALTATVLFALFRATPRFRMGTIAVCGALIVCGPLLVRGNARERLASLFGSEHEEAKASEDSRSYLLKQSLKFTVEHPIFGVGMGQFSTFEGVTARSNGLHGDWHETHNAFTQVSSENGIPALLLMLAGIAGAFVSVHKVHKRARREGHAEIADTAFCYLLSMTGYLVSIIFLAHAYKFYLSAMVGLAIALCATAEREMSRGNAVGPTPRYR
jgi:hypothetical protein